MSKEMLINVSAGEECRIAVVENGKLEELYMERASAVSHVGNVYKGKVTNVEASIQAAFVDFGIGRNGFLHVSDLMPSYWRGEQGDGVKESVGRKLARRDRPPIQHCLRRGDEIVVQVIKEGLGTKGPTLSSYLSIPGRILVMMPGVGKSGVSKKIEDEDERRRLRKILDDLSPPKDAGFIIRTAGVGKARAEIERDFNYLTRLWETIQDADSRKGPLELYAEGDLVMRTVRDVFTSDIERIVTDDADTARRIKDFFKLLMPKTRNRVDLYDGPVPLFHAYRIERDIENMHSRTVPLKSGGSLVIDQTEAVTAIDVNSGKARQSGDAEQTAFKVDLEAADEIPRQLKLRDLGGIVICDFIDLRFERHRRELEERLAENLKRDRAKTRFLAMSEFGIIEMTRQRMRPSLKKSVFHDCPACGGQGLVKTAESMGLDVIRKLQIAADSERVIKVELALHPDIALHVLNTKRIALAKLEDESGKKIVIKTDADLPLDQMHFELYDDRDGLVYLDSLGMVPPQGTQGGGSARREERGGRRSRGGREESRRQPVELHHDDFEEEEEMRPPPRPANLPAPKPAAIRGPQQVRPQESIDEDYEDGEADDEIGEPIAAREPDRTAPSRPYESSFEEDDDEDELDKDEREVAATRAAERAPSRPNETFVDDDYDDADDEEDEEEIEKDERPAITTRASQRAPSRQNETVFEDDHDDDEEDEEEAAPAVKVVVKNPLPPITTRASLGKIAPAPVENDYDDEDEDDVHDARVASVDEDEAEEPLAPYVPDDSRRHLSPAMQSLTASIDEDYESDEQARTAGDSRDDDAPLGGRRDGSGDYIVPTGPSGDRDSEGGGGGRRRRRRRGRRNRGSDEQAAPAGGTSPTGDRPPAVRQEQPRQGSDRPRDDRPQRENRGPRDERRFDRNAPRGNDPWRPGVYTNDPGVEEFADDDVDDEIGTTSGPDDRGGSRRDEPRREEPRRDDRGGQRNDRGGQQPRNDRDRPREDNRPREDRNAPRRDERNRPPQQQGGGGGGGPRRDDNRRPQQQQQPQRGPQNGRRGRDEDRQPIPPRVELPRAAAHDDEDLDRPAPGNSIHGPETHLRTATESRGGGRQRGGRRGRGRGPTPQEVTQARLPEITSDSLVARFLEEPVKIEDHGDDESDFAGNQVHPIDAPIAGGGEPNAEGGEGGEGGGRRRRRRRRGGRGRGRRDENVGNDNNVVEPATGEHDVGGDADDRQIPGEDAAEHGEVDERSSDEPIQVARAAEVVEVADEPTVDEEPVTEEETVAPLKAAKKARAKAVRKKAEPKVVAEPKKAAKKVVALKAAAKKRGKAAPLPDAPRTGSSDKHAIEEDPELLPDATASLTSPVDLEPEYPDDEE